MISIVICSTKRYSELNNLCSNIIDTIGDIKYEIVWIDNTKNDYSIFSAYNLGILKSHYPIICFLHQDVEFKSKNWGNLVLDCFSDKEVGLAGVIGSKYISKKPFGWWCSYSKRGRVFEMLDNNPTLTDYGESFDENVTAIDGLCIFFRKSLFPFVKFDEMTYSGFHFYDMDICMQVLQNNCLIKILKIDLLHKSRGYANLNFYINYLKFVHKYNEKLPVYIDLNDPDVNYNENFYSQYKPVNIYEKILLDYDCLFAILDRFGTFLKIGSCLSHQVFLCLYLINLFVMKLKRHLPL